MPLTKKTVLLVEADKDILRGLTEVLKISGYKVIQATDLSGALKKCEESAVPLYGLIINYSTLHEDGVGFINQIGISPWRFKTIILVTRSSDTSDVISKKLQKQNIKTIKRPFEAEAMLSLLK